MYCTGKRPISKFEFSEIFTVSKKSSSVGPWYQGVFADLSTILSPFKALIGTKVTF